MKQKAIILCASIAVIFLLGLHRGWADTNNPCVAPPCPNPCEVPDTNCVCVSSCTAGQICCGGGCVDSSTYGCCNDTPYNLSDKKCCHEAGAYDPDTQGCCTKPDGSHKITSNPETADPCQALWDAGLVSGAMGKVACYNGQQTPCLYPPNIPSAWASDSNIMHCLIIHETFHTTDDNVICIGCDIGAAPFTSPTNKRTGECAAYAAELACATSLPDSNPNKKDYINDINTQMGAAPPGFDCP